MSSTSSSGAATMRIWPDVAERLETHTKARVAADGRDGERRRHHPAAASARSAERTGWGSGVSPGRVPTGAQRTIPRVSTDPT